MNTICSVAGTDKYIPYAIGSPKKSFKKAFPSSFPSSRVDSDLAKKNILVVENFPIVLNYFLHIFRSLGYRVTVASTGHEAIRKYSKKFDLIFLKVKLSDMGGGEVIQRIREKQKSYKKFPSPTPIIANIATTDNANKDDWVSLGANDVFSNEDGVEKKDFNRLLQKWLLIKD